MKKTMLPVLALAAFAATGCTTDDSATRAASPWAQPGSVAKPNPIVQGITLEDDEQKPDPITNKHYLTYSWRRDNKAAATEADNTVKYVAPEDPRSVRITGVRENYALYSFICADVAPFIPNQQININDGKNAAYFRVVKKDEKERVVVAELLPNQIETPKFDLGVEFRYATTEQEIAANTPAAAPQPDAIPPAASEPPALPPAS